MQLCKQFRWLPNSIESVWIWELVNSVEHVPGSWTFRNLLQLLHSDGKIYFVQVNRAVSNPWGLVKRLKLKVCYRQNCVFWGFIYRSKSFLSSSFINLFRSANYSFNAPQLFSLNKRNLVLYMFLYLLYQLFQRARYKDHIYTVNHGRNLLIST